MGYICFRDKCDTSKRNGACRLNNSIHVVDPIVSDWVSVESDIGGHKPDFSATTSGDYNHSERDVPSRAASETPQYEGNMDLEEPHPDDLD
jgi:hypothetical protein